MRHGVLIEGVYADFLVVPNHTASVNCIYFTIRAKDAADGHKMIFQPGREADRKSISFLVKYLNDWLATAED